jgi:hypothetical protein
VTETTIISRLTVDIPSDLRPGHTHKAGTEIAPVRRVGGTRWIVEIKTEESELVGAAWETSAWYEQLVIDRSQSEIVEVRTTKGLDRHDRDPSQ